VGGNGGEGQSIVESVHGIVEVFNSGLAFVFEAFAPVQVDAQRGAASDAQHEQGVAVAHPAGVLAAVVVFFHEFAQNLALRSIARGERTAVDMVENLLFGEDGNTKAGVGHAPFCRSGQKMISDFPLQLNPQ